MKKGEIVHFFLPGADRDPTHFEQPDAFSLERRPTPHLGFGAGPHRCLGMHLARIELRVGLNAMLDLLPNLRLDPDFPPPRFSVYEHRKHAWTEVSGEDVEHSSTPSVARPKRI